MIVAAASQERRSGPEKTMLVSARAKSDYRRRTYRLTAFVVPDLRGCVSATENATWDNNALVPCMS